MDNSLRVSKVGGEAFERRPGCIVWGRGNKRGGGLKKIFRVNGIGENQIKRRVSRVSNILFPQMKMKGQRFTIVYLCMYRLTTSWQARGLSHNGTKSASLGEGMGNGRVQKEWEGPTRYWEGRSPGKVSERQGILWTLTPSLPWVPSPSAVGNVFFIGERKTTVRTLGPTQRHREKILYIVVESPDKNFLHNFSFFGKSATPNSVTGPYSNRTTGTVVAVRRIFVRSRWTSAPLLPIKRFVVGVHLSGQVDYPRSTLSFILWRQRNPCLNSQVHYSDIWSKKPRRQIFL